MNSHQPVLPQVQPAIPLLNGRPAHNVPYAPPPPFPHHPQQYQNYQYPYPMQYQRPPQQWTPYPMPPPMGRGYQQYNQMTPYPMSQHYPPMRPSPHQAASSSSIHSMQGMLSPSSSNTSLHAHVPAPTFASTPRLAPPTPPAPHSISSPSQRIPFYPPLPWQSFEGSFPPRGPRRRRKPAPQSSNIPVELPSRRGSFTENETVVKEVIPVSKVPPAEIALSRPPNLESPFNSHPPSEIISTGPTTPSSTAPSQQLTPKTNASGRPNLPVLPIIPVVPNVPIAPRVPKLNSVSFESDATKVSPSSIIDQVPRAIEHPIDLRAGDASAAGPSAEAAAAPPAKTAPKSWADLVRTSSQPTVNGTTHVSTEAVTHANGLLSTKTGTLAEALSSYNVKSDKETTKLSFLKPRGLVNTGNMCYMNSILQMLVFCVPFYTFLETIGRQAAHNFHSDTPLMDAMIMFMREFQVIDAADSVTQLRMRLKDSELEQYGEAFIPDFVYDVIRRLPRFSSMRRGHQQDAEEFLGFLLEEMHDECSRAMKSVNAYISSGTSTPTNGVTPPTSASTDSYIADDNGWLEVGPKQRAAVTRSSGAIATESPITKIFGGKLRSELRVPGMKNSVTLEPYQPLQLDIGAPHVSNIIDALKGLTRPETLHGDFNSPRGPGSTATKQVTIETLPQVLILHLKRFQYENTGGTQKIWKKVGYPLGLEIPKEVFPQHKRGGLLAHGGLPKYKLIGVVYHHGKNASGGHYTVDVRRQEGREWIRLDDTVIRRIRSEDVAEGGSEEDPKVLAAALEQHKNDQSSSNIGNAYEQITADEEERTSSEKGWSQVNGVSSTSSLTGKKWSGAANGNATPAISSGKMTPTGRSSVKDNKVAYILFYQRTSA